MRKLKMGIAALTVIVSLLTTPAFRNRHRNSLTFRKAWFAYKTTSLTAAGYQNEANYSLLSARSPTCRTANQVCEIFASVITLSTSPLVQRPHLSILPTFGASVASYNMGGIFTVSPSVIDGVSVDFMTQ